VKIIVYHARDYDISFLDEANHTYGFELEYVDSSLNLHTAALAEGCQSVCLFTSDVVDEETAQRLYDVGVRLITLRCAGYNNVDLEACERIGLAVVHVPAYSPWAVAEHAVGLMLALNRGLHRAYCRVREGNFSLNGLLGFDMHGRTVGIIGTGRIGSVTARILHGMGCTLLAYDIRTNPDCTALGVDYTGLDRLYNESDIITLHCPLTPDTHHMINDESIAAMKDGVMLINTSRGAVIDTQAVIRGLKCRKIGYLGLDVYEQEADLFFRDLSDEIIEDDCFERLLTFPNVLVTGHQGYFTRDALSRIATMTLDNAKAFADGKKSGNELTAARLV